MKKILLSILLLFTFIGCSNVQFHDMKPISKEERTVLVEYFPTNFEEAFEKNLELNFWKVYLVSNQNAASDFKSNFSITLSELYPTTIGTFGGVIKISDLRTGKRIAIYKFSYKTMTGIVEEVTKIMDSIPKK